MRMKLEFEEAFKKIAQSSKAKATVILCDRGVPDSAAYCDEAAFQDILDRYNWSRDKLYSRYDLVIHLETTAFDTPFYSTANNNARTESCEEAREQDRKTQVAWAAHENVVVVRNRSCVVKKNERSIFKSPMPSIAAASPPDDMPSITLSPPVTPLPSPIPAPTERSSFQKKKHLVLRHVLQLLSLESHTTRGEFHKPRLFMLFEPEKCSTANLQIQTRKLKTISALHKIEMETMFLKTDHSPNKGSGHVIDRVIEKRGGAHHWRYYLTSKKCFTTHAGHKEVVLTERRITGSKFFALRQASVDDKKFIINRQRTTFCITRPDPSDQVVRSVTHRIDKYELRRDESLGDKESTLSVPEVTNFIILKVDVDFENEFYEPPKFLGKNEDVSNRPHLFTMAKVASGQIFDEVGKSKLFTK